MRLWRAMSSGVAMLTLAVSVIAWCPCASAAAEAADDPHACCAPRTGISAAAPHCCDDHAPAPPATTPDLPAPVAAPHVYAPVHWSAACAPVAVPACAVPHPSPPLVLRI